MAPSLVLFADATQYAHYVFKTFKNGHTGTIKFEVRWIARRPDGRKWRGNSGGALR